MGEGQGRGNCHSLLIPPNCSGSSHTPPVSALLPTVIISTSPAATPSHQCSCLHLPTNLLYNTIICYVFLGPLTPYLFSMYWQTSS